MFSSSSSFLPAAGIADEAIFTAMDIADAIVEIRQTGNQRENADGGRMEDDVGTFKNWSDLK